MTERTGGAVLVDALVDHGVEVVWGIPGTHNLAVYERLATSSIRHLLPRHEQGAAFAADGYARSSARPGVCLTTSGPAVLNAATAMAQAYSDSVPVLLVSAGMPVRHPGRGNGNLHETKDLRAAMNGIVDYSHRVTSVEEIPAAVAEAFASMTSGRPRPVHLEVPYDVLDTTGTAARIGPLPPARRTPDPGALRDAAHRLAGARRPAILVGGGAVGAVDELQAVAEQLQAPVVCSTNGKGTLADDHPLALGAGLHRAPVADLVAESDLVLVVGCELSPADLWEGPLDLDGKLLRIDIDPHQAVTNGVPVQAVVGDARAVLGALAATLPTLPVEEATERAVSASRLAELFSRDALTVSAPWRHVLDPIDEALGRDGILAGDSTTICYFGAVAALSSYRPRSFLYPSGYGTLGYGLPAAIGAKVAHPDRPVICLIGDGGVMFTLAELASAAQAGLALPVVIADNSGYGEIRAEMLQRGQQPLAVDLPSPDFGAVARGLGCAGEQIEPQELPGALARALGADVPTVLHVRTA